MVFQKGRVLAQDAHILGWTLYMKSEELDWK